MNIESLVWGYIPSFIALTCIIWSFLIFMNNRSHINIIFFVLIASINVFAIHSLAMIFFGAWPTYIPHILIGLTTAFFFIQKIVQRKMSNHERE